MTFELHVHRDETCHEHNFDKKDASLTAAHRQYLRDAGLTDEIIDGRGYMSFARPSHGSPEGFRRDFFNDTRIWIEEAEQMTGILIPLFGTAGLSTSQTSWTYRPDIPAKDRDGKVRKYLQPSRVRSVLDIHPLFLKRGVRGDSDVPLWVTEGAKKADALASRGEATIMLAGVANWQAAREPLPDWDTIYLKGREVRICFDADATKNKNVARQMRDLGAYLTGKGAKVVYVTPPVVNDDPKTGVDDYLVAGGTIGELLASASSTPPEAARRSAGKLVETVVADELAADLDGRFIYVPELGWLAWSTTHWATVSDDVVRGVVAVWVRKQLDAALDEAKATGNMDAAEAWYGFNSRAKIDNITTLARSLLLVDVHDLDANPDLLNCANGTVDLQTGVLLPHDPQDYMTIVAPAAYDPDAKSAVWEQVLQCIPEDILAWMQSKLGQAVTGHIPDDDKAGILQGSGENGKTLLMNLISKALGSYYYAAPPKVLMMDVEKSLAPEIADLRGKRLVAIEEFPEKNVSSYRLKQLNGGTQITARHLYKENFSFDPSHSLFVTTNYLPVITDTDHGTWRRLALIPFPFKFVDEPDLDRPNEKPRDFELRAKTANPDADLLTAVLRWLVQGAVDWYKAGRLLPELPDRVRQATDEWRATADDILRFWDECLVADPESAVPARDLFAAFGAWAKQNGQMQPSERTFKPKFETHFRTVENHVTVTTVNPDKVNISSWYYGQPVQKFRGWKGIGLTTHFEG